MRVLIAAGGTAGHINPALAIAGALKQADPAAEIHFAGRREGMEYGLVTKAGYPFHHIEINGFQRKLSVQNVGRNLMALYHLALSGPRTAAILKEVRPDLVIGCGGYVSGPVVRAAAKRGIRTAIHEQNAFPGVTNKLLAKDVNLVMAASAAAVEKLGAPDKTVVVGNPVRPEVLTASRAEARAAIGAGDRTVILSFGGSLGAQRINEVVESGQSCAIYLGHYCNWEWITSLPLWVTPKAHCGQIYHPLENKDFDKLFLRMRQRFGAKCIAMNNTLREMVRYRKEGQPVVIGYISDQVPMWQNIHHWCNFLHHDTPVLTGTERIARSMNHAVFYMEVSRVKRGYY